MSDKNNSNSNKSKGNQSNQNNQNSQQNTQKPNTEIKPPVFERVKKSINSIKIIKK